MRCWPASLSIALLHPRSRDLGPLILTCSLNNVAHSLDSTQHQLLTYFLYS